jgi:hypothetical protein
MSGVYIVHGADTSNTQEVILANSADLDFSDPVKIDSSGFLAAVTAGDKVQGFFAQASTTVASDNQTVGLIKGRYQPVADGMVLELTADQACTQTDLGAYADFVISSGDFKANLAAGASGQLEIIDFDPNRDGTTTLVRAVIAEPEALAFAQA